MCQILARLPKKVLMNTLTTCTTYCYFYFCLMFFHIKKYKTIDLMGLWVLLALAASCDFIREEEPTNLPIARVGERYLYQDDVTSFLAEGISKEDSVSFVTNYINHWASKQLLLSKAKVNLPEHKLAEFDALVADYRTDLYTRAYKEALVQQGSDTLITDMQLARFYEAEKENFRLKEKLVRIRFVQLPKQFLNKEAVVQSLKNFKESDIAFLDSIGVHFNKLNFNDSLWISASRVINEIPPLTVENQDAYLKNSQFFELEDALGVYLAKITGVLEVNDVAPLSYIEPTIRQVILSRRKLDYIKKLETEIIDEAIKKKEFEVYTKKE